MKQIDPKLLKQIFSADNMYGKGFVERREAFVDKICLLLEEILAPILNEKLTFKTFMQAKLLFIKYLLESNILDDFPEKIFKVMVRREEKELTLLDDVFYQPAFDKKNLKADNESLEKAATILTEIIEGCSENTIDKEESGEKAIKEDDYIRKTNTGLNGVNNAKYLEGTLTVGELLMSQPNVLLRNFNFFEDNKND